MTSTNNQTSSGSVGSIKFGVVVIALVLSSVLHANPDYIPKAIDINKADTTVFIALPGIGSKLANRIVTYREKLHGFYSVQQVAEVFGLADSAFQKIKPWLIIKDTLITKININTAGTEDLKTPYISYNLANAIYEYRMQHGSFTSLTDLKKIMLVNDALFNKILPYLTIG